MEFNVQVKKTLYTDNDKKFRVNDDICFVLISTGDKYIGKITKIKAKSIVIEDIVVNDKQTALPPMKVKLDDIKPYSCQYVYVD